jgi:transcriptional regulator with XRE-family HTH domain
MKPRVCYGPQIAARRREMGLSRDELAARTGIRPGTIWRYERGLIEPSGSHIAILARALGVSIDSLATFEAA